MTTDVAQGELATYREYLDHYRQTFQRQCAGLTPEQLATRAVPPSTLSLLGLARHLAYVEQIWFQRRLQGQAAEPLVFTSPDDPDHDFNGAVGTAECVAEAFAAWQEQVEDADGWLGTITDGDLGRVVAFDNGRSSSIRDILVHMIEEYARHCGHADLLRECLDGRTDL